jgi:hypothetical protein
MYGEEDGELGIGKWGKGGGDISTLITHIRSFFLCLVGNMKFVDRVGEGPALTIHLD